MAIRLSKTTWSLLDVLRLRLDVEVHVFDAELRPVTQEPGWTPSDILDEPGLRDRCVAVLTSAETRLSSQSDPSLIVVPVRRGRETLGGAVITAGRRDHDAAFAADRATLEVAAQIAQGVIESDLALTGELSRVSERARRLQGILRFLGVLARPGSEEDVMQAVVQAATVWFDLDCRVYHRTADDSYSLFMALPGLEAHEVRDRLDGARMRQAVAAGRLLTTSDLDEFGWRGRRGEALVVPVGTDLEWVMLIAGDTNQEVELTFSAVAHVLAAQLHQSAAVRSGHWRSRLAAHTDLPRAAPERVLLGLLDDLAVAIDARGAGLALVSQGARRTLAAVGMPGLSEERTAHAFNVGAGTEAVLEVWTAAAPLPFASQAMLHSWIDAVQPWLRGTVLGMLTYAGTLDSGIDTAVFERRIQDEVERAKRFNLGLGLVLVSAEPAPAAEPAQEDALMRVIRPQLRASDVTGTVRGGMLAILLVHSGAEGADSVVGRLRQRFAAALQVRDMAVRIGHAVFSPECASAEALLQRALGHMWEPNANG